MASPSTGPPAPPVGRTDSGPSIEEHDEDTPLLRRTSTHSSQKLALTSKSTGYLALLALPVGGLQIAWTVQQSNFTAWPYLLSLGLTKALMALIWIIGPICGVLVQPYIGVQSDNSRSRFGKRVPFMLMGGIGTAGATMGLAWTRELVEGIARMTRHRAEEKGVVISIQIVAVFWVFLLNVAINVVQASIRAFIVDNAPPHQQALANAWASRMTGFGNILGFLSGWIDLPHFLPFFGNTQFKDLCALASVALAGTLALSSGVIRERDARFEHPAEGKAGVLSFLKHIFASVKRLPAQVKRVCAVQFFAWIGWFPYLFYYTTYVGQLYADPYFTANPNLSSPEIDAIMERATRRGTMALFVFALTSFSASLILPLLVSQVKTAVHSPISFLNNLQIPFLTLPRLWVSSNLLAACCLLSTFFIRTPTGATVLTGFIGISWAVSLWAPFALISAEISARDTERRRLERENPDAADVMVKQVEDQAGVVLGLHNVAISAPQVVATLGSSLVFKLLQKGRGEPGDESVAWVLRIGALSMIVAAVLARSLRDDASKRLAVD